MLTLKTDEWSRYCVYLLPMNPEAAINSRRQSRMDTSTQEMLAHGPISTDRNSIPESGEHEMETKSTFCGLWLQFRCRENRRFANGFGFSRFPTPQVEA